MSGVGKTLQRALDPADIFKLGGDAPAAPVAPPPTPSMADKSVQEAAEAARKRSGAGRPSTILGGATDEEEESAKLLLGAG
jgi:hypothetical protein